MALYKPTQYLDFYFSEAHETLYLRASFRVDLLRKEYIINPIQTPDKQPPFLTIHATIMINPYETRKGWYSQPMTVLFKIIPKYNPELYDLIDGDDPETILKNKKIIHENKEIIRASIFKFMGEPEDGNEFVVMTKLFNEGNPEAIGEVQTHLNSGGNIVIDRIKPKLK